jgi:hypothetical protein
MASNSETAGDRETEQEDDFNRARVELELAVIDYEMTAEEARAERRKRRERMRDSSSSSDEGGERAPHQIQRCRGRRRGRRCRQ